ncbi:thioredoxin [Desulfacinum hydrothermale DSM 13146]|uniref:Thioredoxin n=1 Tax=Desulfacinum hydrothermale DSM 13146 TaxID=1121390 RepID=A0A1W1XNT1_9BACT|nr:thioredoxin TrxC [Desulfacinum hydrothermale]SMC25640.1 thioredoxin [Desulfacinum hydrothermale DSM 13146]
MQEFIHVVCPRCSSINRVDALRLLKQPVCGRCSSQLLPGKPLEVDRDQFEKHVMRTDLPVVVDFWAPWCGPCRMMAPAFQEAARRLKASARFLKVNTEKEQGLAARHGIRSIPTVVVFKNGRERGRRSGAMDAGALVRWVGEFVE